MIIELVTGVALIALGTTAARRIVKRRQKAAKVRTSGRKGGVRRVSKGPRGLRVGDALLYLDAQLWLAGSVDLDEAGFVARFFTCPGSKEASWVAQMDEEAHTIALLQETDEVPAGNVPEELPIQGRRLRLERRGVATLRCEGEDVPALGASTRFALLSGAGDRVLWVLDFEDATRLALVGDRISRTLVDVLPGGDAEEDEI